MTNRTLMAAITMIRTVAVVADAPSFDNHQVLVAVAIIRSAQMALAGLIRTPMYYLIK
jgi:hypothetical protein